MESYRFPHQCICLRGLSRFNLDNSEHPMLQYQRRLPQASFALPRLRRGYPLAYRGVLMSGCQELQVAFYKKGEKNVYWSLHRFKASKAGSLCVEL